MTYTVIDHGNWERYIPNPLPEWAVGTAIAFARRTTDGVDWYEFRNNIAEFAKDSIVCTVLLDPSDGVETVKAVFRDETMIFPAGSRVIEVRGFDETDPKPHNTLAWMIYDPESQTLLPPAPLPWLSVTAKKDLWTRATVAEAEKMDAFISKQTIRDQRIFNDAAPLNHSDALYASLVAGFTELFGEKRAKEILAAS